MGLSSWKTAKSRDLLRMYGIIKASWTCSVRSKPLQSRSRTWVGLERRRWFSRESLLETSTSLAFRSSENLDAIYLNAIIYPPGLISKRVQIICRYPGRDRKSTRLNSSHLGISYAVFCLKKKKKH